MFTPKFTIFNGGKSLILSLFLLVQTLIQTTECKQVRARNIQSQLCDSQLVRDTL